jgi:hypothetical protein
MDQNVKPNTDWLLVFYSAIAQKASQNGECIVQNFEYTFSFDDIQNTFPIIEDTGYTSAKSKQLMRNYWNDKLDGILFNHFQRGDTNFSFKPHGQRKKTTDSTHGDFCLQNVIVTINNDIVDVEVTTRSSEVFQVILGDLWFFNQKIRTFADAFDLKMGSLTFKIGISTLGVFAVRSYMQIKIIQSRTPDEREEYWNDFFDVIYQSNPDLALRMTTRFLSYFLTPTNVTPTYAKLKSGFAACQKLLTQQNRNNMAKKMKARFPNELLALQNKRKMRNQSKFYDLI